jgi:hypothetical protein
LRLIVAQARTVRLLDGLALFRLLPRISPLLTALPVRNPELPLDSSAEARRELALKKLAPLQAGN